MVKYYLIQFTRRLLRREAINVGVIVRRRLETGKREAAARFVGEHGGLFDDGERGVYVQWVEYWRDLIARLESESDLFRDNGGNFNVIRGGEVECADLESALDYLYPLLVSDGGERSSRQQAWKRGRAEQRPRHKPRRNDAAGTQ